MVCSLQKGKVSCMADEKSTLIKKCAITTIDNKIDPFEQPIRWVCEDHRLGHNTSEMLARLTFTCFAQDVREYWQEIERGIDEMIRLNPYLYRKVYAKDPIVIDYELTPQSR